MLQQDLALTFIFLEDDTVTLSCRYEYALPINAVVSQCTYSGWPPQLAQKLGSVEVKLPRWSSVLQDRERHCFMGKWKFCAVILTQVTEVSKQNQYWNRKTGMNPSSRAKDQLRIWNQTKIATPNGTKQRNNWVLQGVPQVRNNLLLASIYYISHMTTTGSGWTGNRLKGRVILYGCATF